MLFKRNAAINAALKQLLAAVKDEREFISNNIKDTCTLERIESYTALVNFLDMYQVTLKKDVFELQAALLERD